MQPYRGKALGKGQGIMATVREVTHDLLRDMGMITVLGNTGSTELPLSQYLPE